jgi:hypothetical protein
MKTKMKLKYGRIISREENEQRQREWNQQHPDVIWTLWYHDSKEVDHFIASFPTQEEARRHYKEVPGQGRVSWRFEIEGYDAHTKEFLIWCS